ncbi:MULTISPECIES: M56 family metallopeptidase [Nocardioides]|uniref:M56 family metallopeptidase n=1 Tax=Nocardioides cremeus TaxID=3058044 RepID=A0ABT8TP74_9ACTN|nr:M56 family metallopeptidase [Nocardioides cremeus]MDO3395636.1 M56 family metallopeptidase [Nocardioides cremeus]
MIADVALVVVAVLAATLGPRLLQRSTSIERSPWVGIVLWQSLSVSAVAAVVLTGAALALPAVPLTNDLAALLSACGAALRAQYETPGGAAASATGAVLAVSVLGRVIYCLAAEVALARSQRARLRRSLLILAQTDPCTGALVLEHEAPVAYCVPGHGGRVVMTSAALETLRPDELEAVMAHERAHLVARHHLVLAVSRALARAFPGVPVFRDAHVALTRLVEMHADDVAASCNERLSIATAVVRMAESKAPAAALGAGGPTSVARVRRLLAPADPLRASGVAAALVIAAVLVLAPLGILAAPAVVAATADLCPIDFPTDTV